MLYTTAGRESRTYSESTTTSQRKRRSTPFLTARMYATPIRKAMKAALSATTGVTLSRIAAEVRTRKDVRFNALTISRALSTPNLTGMVSMPVAASPATSLTSNMTTPTNIAGI